MVEGQVVGTLGLIEVVVTAGGEVVTFRPAVAGTETALILAEVYLRGGQPKVRAVGQGFASGLAGVATRFGVEIAEEAPAVGGAPVGPPPSGPPGVRG